MRLWAMNLLGPEHGLQASKYPDGVRRANLREWRLFSAVSSDLAREAPVRGR